MISPQCHNLIRDYTLFLHNMKKLFPTHDDFIRNILSNKEVAIDYLKTALPEHIVNMLDFSTLKQISETYVSDTLEKTISDIVFECRLKDTNKTIRICLLIEHKSHPDKYASIQVGSYIFSSFLKQIQNKEPLSVVVPILLYHGEKRWKCKTLDELFKDIDEELKQFIPSFDFIFNDLGKLDDHAIEALQNKFLAASFLALKHNWNKEWLEKNVVKLLTLAMEGPEGLQKGIIIYIGSRSVFNENVLNSLPDSIKKDVMNSLEIYYERGIKEGLEKGLERGLERGRIEKEEGVVRNLLATGQFTISQIANYASVSESFVRKVKALLK